MATFVAVCAEHLKHAIDESRKEMDDLTMAILKSDRKESSDVIARLQSIDRLMQRLTNVKSNLDHLACYLEVGNSEKSLADLAEQLRLSFTMPSEREIFDAMTGYHCDTPTQSEDEVVLF